MRFDAMALFLVAVASFPLLAEDRLPCAIQGETSRRLECNHAVTAALKAYDPAFRAYAEQDYLPMIRRFFKWSPRHAPFAAIGDFNGDGVLDVAIDGQSRQRRRLIVVQSGKEGFTVAELQRLDGVYAPEEDRYDDERGKWVFVSQIIPAGRVRPLVDASPVELKYPAFEIEYWQKAATVFYWNGMAWSSYTSGD